MKKTNILTLLLIGIYLWSNEARGQVKPKATDQSKALFPVISSTNGKVGYIDLSGRVTIEPQFDKSCSNNKPPSDCLQETQLRSRPA